MKIILLGPPGAGKGTQAANIVDTYGVPHISTGDIFRKNIKEGTELGKKAQEYINQGKLVPDELTCGLVASRISEDDCKDGFMLDGFPRNIFQAEYVKTVVQLITSNSIQVRKMESVMFVNQLLHRDQMTMKKQFLREYKFIYLKQNHLLTTTLKRM